MRRPVFMILAAGVIGVAACDNERAIGNEPVGDPAYGIRFLIGGTNTPQGTVQFAVPAAPASGDTVRLTLRGLDSLEGEARYTLWVRDSQASAFQRFPATIRVTKTDTVLDQFGDPVAQATTTTLPLGTSAFANGGSRTSISIIGTMPATFPAGRRPGLVLVTIEANDAATTPNPDRRPVWARRTTFTAPAAARAANAGTVSFGFWSSNPDSLYVYPIGPQRGRAVFRGNVLIVNDSSLPRPPRGYYYATYLVKKDDTNQPFDTVYLGPQTAPAPLRDVSLFHADSVIVEPRVQTASPPQITAASTRVMSDTVEGLTTNIPFRGVGEVLVTLELKEFKTEDRLGPAVVLRADVPTIVRNGPALP